jgi:hypothetical protein
MGSLCCLSSVIFFFLYAVRLVSEEDRRLVLYRTSFFVLFETTFGQWTLLPSSGPEIGDSCTDWTQLNRRFT